jgi:hypothetical protein
VLGWAEAERNVIFDEAKHPRGPNGEWIHGAGSLPGGAPVPPAVPAAAGAAGEHEAYSFLWQGLDPNQAGAAQVAEVRGATSRRVGAAMKSATADLVAAADPDLAWKWKQQGNPRMAFSIDKYGRLADSPLSFTDPDAMEHKAAELAKLGNRDVHQGGTPGVEGVFREAAVSALIKQWAWTSNDTEAKSLAIQEAARREFHLDSAAGWEPEPSPDPEGYGGALNALIGGGTDADFKAHEGVYRDFLRTEYALTQADLKAAGISAVRLYRGYAWDHRAEVPGWVGRRTGPVPPLRPLSSWSSSESLAGDFAADEGNYGAVVSAAVPAEAIISTSRSGQGVLPELEFVTLPVGGMANVRRVGAL